MTPRHRRIPVAVLCIGSALAMSACGIKVEPERGSPPEAARQTTTGGTLKVGVTAPGRIDPIGASTPAARMITQAMCDTMVQIDPVTHQVRPGLAKATVEAGDGSFLTVMLLHGLAFHDGATLKSTDVNASLKALGASYNGSPFRALLDPFKGGVLGSQQKEESKVNPLLEGGAPSDKQPAQALNDYDVQLNANPANGASLRLLADPAMAPVSAEAMGKDIVAFEASPSCVGPYKLESPYRAGQKSLTLVRNPSYPAKNLGFTAGGRGYVDRIVFSIYPTDEEALAAYRAGKEDLVRVPSSSLSKPGVSTNELVTGASTDIEYLGFPATDQGISVKPVVRKALSMVLDRRRLAALGGWGTRPAESVLPESLGMTQGVEANASGLTVPQCSAAPSTPRVAEAKALLAKHGISLKGEKLAINYDSSPRHKIMIDEVVKTWNTVFGADVVALDMPWGVQKQLSTGFNSPVRMAWSTAAVGPVPGQPDVQTYLTQLAGPSQQAGVNWAQYADPEFTEILTKKFPKAADQHARERLVGRMTDRMCEELPYAPLTQYAQVWALRPSVAGAREVGTGVDGLPLLRELFLRDPS